MTGDPLDPAETRPPKCIVCHVLRTADSYELGERELESLMKDRGIWRAARVHAKYGAVPICRACFESLGFELEGGRPGESVSPLVAIRRREPKA